MTKDIVTRLRDRVARSEPEGFVEVHIDFLTEAADIIESYREAAIEQSRIMADIEERNEALQSRAAANPPIELDPILNAERN